MVAAIDVSGERYGRLVAVRRTGSIGGRSAWLFRCDCGAEATIRLETVRQGIAKSCGCLRRDVTATRSITHGHARGRVRSRELRSWDHAKGRCFNPNDPKYPQYGGRGITMCGQWAESFEAFIADLGPCPPKHTLGRIRVDGNYEPGNCRWETLAQQARARTDNVWVEHNGQRVVLKDFAAAMGVPYKRLHAKVRYAGMTPHEAARAISQ